MVRDVGMDARRDRGAARGGRLRFLHPAPARERKQQRHRGRDQVLERLHLRRGEADPHTALPRSRPGARSRWTHPRLRQGAGDEPFRGPRDHHVLDLGRGREPRAVPGDPVHARGVRGGGAPDRGRGRRDDPHPRAHARRSAELRGRGLPQHHRRDPHRGRRRDHQLLDRRRGRADREAPRVSARAAARGGRAQHGLDELREVLEAAQGVRLPHRVRELVRHDHDLPERDERARHQARARVLRLRPHREPRSAARHGPAARAAADLVRDGRDRRHPPERQEPRAHVGPDPRRRAGPERVGRDRHLARPVDAGRRRPHAGRQLPRRPRGQLLPAERRHGALQRRPDREGAADGGGRGAGGRRRWPKRARCSERRKCRGPRKRRPRRRRDDVADARRTPRTPDPRPHPAAAGRLLHVAARRHGRRGAESRRHGRRRLHQVDAALLRRRRGAEGGRGVRLLSSRSTATSGRCGST